MFQQTGLGPLYLGEKLGVPRMYVGAVRRRLGW